MVNVHSDFLLLSIYFDRVHSDLTLTLTRLALVVVTVQCDLPKLLPLRTAIETLLIFLCYIWFVFRFDDQSRLSLLR